jgi:hypothetical protein
MINIIYTYQYRKRNHSTESCSFNLFHTLSTEHTPLYSDPWTLGPGPTPEAVETGHHGPVVPHEHPQATQPGHTAMNQWIKNGWPIKNTYLCFWKWRIGTKETYLDEI